MGKRAREGGGLVYSTGLGRMCPGCSRPVDACECRQREAAAPAPGGPIRVARATQGRKGKAVTVVTGLPLSPDELERLAKELKAHCGTGGTVREGAIELQGEQRDRVLAELLRRGWKAKKSGG